MGTAPVSSVRTCQFCFLWTPRAVIFIKPLYFYYYAINIPLFPHQWLNPLSMSQYIVFIISLSCNLRPVPSAISELSSAQQPFPRPAQGLVCTISLNSEEHVLPSPHPPTHPNPSPQTERASPTVTVLDWEQGLISAQQVSAGDV